MLWTDCLLVLGAHTITVMTSTLMSYVVAIAAHLGTAVKETGVNVLHWHEELDKYTGIPSTMTFRNADGNTAPCQRRLWIWSAYTDQARCQTCM